MHVNDMRPTSIEGGGGGGGSLDMARGARHIHQHRGAWGKYGSSLSCITEGGDPRET